jgi:hypothetical protein
MSFWDLSDGESAATGEKEYEQESGNLSPIPNDSSVLAIIDEAKWQETRDRDAEFISLRWSVMEPAEYANRKVFQKLWVTDDDPNAKDADKAAKKRDKAKKMLAAIDANCGGKLAKKAGRPSDDDLALALTNRPMIIKCMVWEMKGSDGTMNSGNWIAAVSPKAKGVDVKAAKEPARKAEPAKSAFDDLDDDVPFD